MTIMATTLALQKTKTLKCNEKTYIIVFHYGVKGRTFDNQRLTKTVAIQLNLQSRMESQICYSSAQLAEIAKKELEIKNVLYI